MTKRQFEMNEEVADTGILIIPGMGSDPGTSNVLRRYVSDVLGDVDEIHIRYGSSTTGETFFLCNQNHS